MDILFGKTITMLSQVLDYRARKHDVLVSNIANIDTPGYRAREATFDRELALQLQNEVRKPGQRGKGVPGHAQPLVTVVESERSVSMDEEMSNLAENTIMYNLGVELLSRKLRSLRDVVREVK